MLSINMRVSGGINKAALFRAPRDLFAFLQMVIIWSFKCIF